MRGFYFLRFALEAPLRLIKGYTQQELADKIGYSVGFISNIESKSYLQTFSLDTLYLISQKLNINIKQLFDE